MAKIKTRIHCENCNSLAYYDPYFKSYVCTNCGWNGKDPVESYIKEVVEETGITKQELLQIIDNVIKISYLSNNYDIQELNEMKVFLESEVMSESD